VTVADAVLEAELEIEAIGVVVPLDVPELEFVAEAVEEPVVEAD